MEDNMQKKLVWAIVGLGILLVGVGFGGRLMTEKVANRVIVKLQKEYSPSPYGPGMDPDKLNPPPKTAPPANPVVPLAAPKVSWEDRWEKTRRD